MLFDIRVPCGGASRAILHRQTITTGDNEAPWELGGDGRAVLNGTMLEVVKRRARSEVLLLSADYFSDSVAVLDRLWAR